MSNYGEGPTFDGMGEIVSGSLSTICEKYKQRIKDLEAQVERAEQVLKAINTYADHSVYRCCGKKAGKIWCENYGCGYVIKFSDFVRAYFRAKEKK